MRCRAAIYAIISLSRLGGIVISFSLRTKEELAKLPLHRPCCQRAELTALARLSGTIELLSGGKLQLRFDTESSVIAWRIFELIRQIYHFGCEVQMREGQRLYKHNSYRVRVLDTDIARQMLDDVGILLADQEIDQAQPLDQLLESDCCRRSFLRGAFLAAGSLSDPARAYHLEIVARDETLARLIERLICGYDMAANTINRKESNVVYLKDSENIVDLLNLMGATRALLEMENIRVEKSVRNNVNRAINCETANLDKTMSAAARQYEAIQTIERMGKFRTLSPQLRQVAEARLENPQATLQQIADMLPQVSKSGVNHRLRKLVDIANDLRGQRGESR